MPVMDGHEAAKAIRKLGIRTPIIALTAKASTDEPHLVTESGMQQTLFKVCLFPFELSENPLMITYLLISRFRTRCSCPRFASGSPSHDVAGVTNCAAARLACSSFSFSLLCCCLRFDLHSCKRFSLYLFLFLIATLD